MARNDEGDFRRFCVQCGVVKLVDQDGCCDLCGCDTNTVDEVVKLLELAGLARVCSACAGVEF